MDDTDGAASQVQRRIELQSGEDLAYLVGNVRAAAAARVDEAFPPRVAGPGDGNEEEEEEEDGLRDAIAALVDEYIDRTFALAAPNLAVNGLPVPATTTAAAPDGHDPSPPRAAAYEPFDARKRQRVADLVATEERLLEDVAALKRRVPAAAAAARAARVHDALARDDARAQHRVAAVAASAAEELVPPLPPLPRQPAVEARFRAAVDALARLKRDMPAVVARMERARLAGEYVVTEGLR